MERIAKVCLHCGQDFFPDRPIRLKNAKFCSRVCFFANYTTPIEDRFWDKVKKSETCWTWTRALTGAAYGVIRYGPGQGKTALAHRLSWEIANGPIPLGLFVCHHCDNPSCVRPDHLFLGTHKDNMQDAKTKGRLAVGESNGRSKLAQVQIDSIRRRYHEGGVSQKRLAEEYSVDASSISLIVNGRRWAHTPLEGRS